MNVRLSIAQIMTLLLLAGCGGTGARDTVQRDAPDGADEPGPAATEEEAEPGECPVVGRWSGTVPGGMLEGTTMTLQFSEDGTAVGRADWVTLHSRWERSGDAFEIVDVRADPPMASCPPDEVGRYTIRFEGCRAVRVVDGEDPCRHRRLALMGLRGSRAD